MWVDSQNMLAEVNYYWNLEYFIFLKKFLKYMPFFHCKNTVSSLVVISIVFPMIHLLFMGWIIEYEKSLCFLSLPHYSFSSFNTYWINANTWIFTLFRSVESHEAANEKNLYSLRSFFLLFFLFFFKRLDILILQFWERLFLPLKDI